jgi:hypothetical protein
LLWALLCEEKKGILAFGDGKRKKEKDKWMTETEREGKMGLKIILTGSFESNHPH